MAYKNPNYHAEYKAKNKEKISAQNSQRYAEKKEHILEVNRLWREANRVKKAAIDKAWQSANKAKRAASENKRRAAKLCATPSWLTSEDLENILKIYEHAASLGYHVDHIVPLRGRKVCGLHVPWNLQPLPPRENCIKNNRFDEA